MTKFNKITILCLILAFCLTVTAVACPTPEPKSVYPLTGLNNASVTLIIEGAFFHKSASVRLTKQGQPDIPATLIKRTATQIICSVDLKGAAIGQWNVIVANTGTFTKKLKPFTMKDAFTIEYPAPQIASINPTKGDNNQVIALEVHGLNLRAGAAVKLSKDGAPDIAATNVVIGPTSLTCDANLNGATDGAYNVVVTNDDGKSTVLNNGFTIQQAVNSSASNTSGNGISNDKVASSDQPTVGSNGESGSSVTPGGESNIASNASSVANPNGESSSSPKGKKKSTPGDKSNIASNGSSTGNANENPNEAIAQGQDGITDSDPNSQIKPIFFDFDRYSIRNDQVVQLNQDIQVIKLNSKMFIILGGHADERGSAQYNLKLSGRRAQSVKNYLMKHGINESQIVVYAYGKDHPAKLGHDETSWWYNRRVDITLWETQPDKDEALVETVNP